MFVLRKRDTCDKDKCVDNQGIQGSRRPGRRLIHCPSSPRTVPGDGMPNVTAGCPEEALCCESGEFRLGTVRQGSENGGALARGWGAG